MNIKFSIGCIFILLTQVLLGQSELIDISNHADCKSMKTIQLRPIVGPMSAPKGFGDVLEFSNNEKRDTLHIEQENNTVWYKFETKASGELNFELIPLDSLNDYDFAVYKYSDANFCEAVVNKSIAPIRTNFSRNKPENAGKTGLKQDAKFKFIAAGVNPAYSKGIKVKKGEHYVLLLNNVYPNGKGHTLKFSYSGTVARKDQIVKKTPPKIIARGDQFADIEKLTFSGVVLDEDNQKVIVATVSLTDVETGELLAETTSDSITGKYELEIDKPSSLNSSIQLEVYKDDYFFQDTVIKAYSVLKDLGKVRLDRKIRKLKKGDKFVVNNILFYGDSPKPLPQSLPTMKSLYKMMKRNKHLVISIEGHTNGCSKSRKFSDELSKARAMTVVNFLHNEKIDMQRMEHKGWGCKKMIYSMNSFKSMYNRRVEIIILEL